MLGLQHRSFRGNSPVQGRVTDTWINEHLVFGGLCNFVLDISEALQWLPSCSVWISCCFCNKLPQIQCLKTLWMYYPPVLGIRSLESRGWQDSVPILPPPVQPPVPYLVASTHPLFSTLHLSDSPHLCSQLPLPWRMAVIVLGLPSWSQALLFQYPELSPILPLITYVMCSQFPGMGMSVSGGPLFCLPHGKFYF